MSATDYLNAVLSEMKTVLKPAGFRKQASTFQAERNDVSFFVQLQSSSMSTKDLLRVTVNLGIFSKTMAQVVRNTHKPNLYESHWRERIGYLMTDRCDKWWNIRNHEEARLAGLQIAEILSSNVLPAMDALNSTEKLLTAWEQGTTSGLSGFEEYLRVLARQTTT